MLARVICGLLFFLFGFQVLKSQPDVKDFKDQFQIHIKEIKDPIDVDGKLEEVTWASAEIGSNFWQKIPFFAEAADPRTEVLLAYDDDNIYVAAKCFQKQDIIIQSLKRDEYWDNDGIAIILDPLNTRTNATIFGVTAAGAQWDALRSQTGGINDDWSNKWYSEVYVSEEYWSMEMKIPLRIIRYGKDIEQWGMNFVRNHLNESEYHNWTAVPESFWPPDPAFAGSLVWDKAPEPKKGNYNLIPYTTLSLEKSKGETTELETNAGLDARVSVTPTLNLDLTLNPDFSQIEVDELVTNLTRFSIFLPEKRTFFLENSDLFADFGQGDAAPFFSRRIGLDQNRQTVPILYGMRLTGNLNPDLRIGVMNIHSLKSDNTAAQNQSALSFQRRFGRSYVQGLFLNRQGFDGYDAIESDYGRNASLEAAYVSDNGQYVGKIGLHRSFKDGFDNKSGFYNAEFQFTNPAWEIGINHTYMERNYFADMGFIARIENYDAERDTSIRIGYSQTAASAEYKIRPLGGKIARHEFRLENEIVFDENWDFNERTTNARYTMVMRSRAEWSAEVLNSEVQLLFPFSFVSDATPLPAERYTFSFLRLRYNSDDRKLISYRLSGRTGGFYNGTLHQAEANLQFRAQPWGNFSIGYQWNDLEFPDEFGQETITAFLANVEIGFNRNLLWATLFQFQDQNEFMGINSRLQWRFAPMSDIFLVYVDNYDVFNGMGGPREVQSNNRALVVKVNYWW
ncbi:MAG: DUF5916 domain-containing protein [Bacteroidota bacterium]